MNFFRKHGLLFVVFITGAAVLVVEILALRILSPYYGNTIFSASSVISVILAALSLGYYVGGKAADKYPSLRVFFGIILVSGVLVFFLERFITGILPNVAHNFSIFWGPLIAAVVMFFVPSFLLGTLSPYVIKLQQQIYADQGIGTISGRTFFWSTLGSIVGSLMTGFVLIPNFPINNIIMSVGIILILLGAIPLIVFKVKKKFLISLLVIVASNIFIVATSAGEENKGLIYKKDGVYQEIAIYDLVHRENNRPVRLFYQGRSADSGVYKDSDELLFKYFWYYDIYKILKPQVNNFMLIGTAAYIVPKEIMAKLPDTEMDLVDIEPGLMDLAIKYFDFKPNDKVHDYVDDGRSFLYHSDKKYDYIFGDAFSSFYSMPTHLSTREFFQIAKSKLTEEGIFVGNFIGSLALDEKSVTWSQVKTFKEVFPNSHFIATTDTKTEEIQNILFVGHNSETKIDMTSPENMAKLGPLSSDLDQKLIDVDAYDLDRYQILTDNFAPVDYLTGFLLKKVRHKPSYY